MLFKSMAFATITIHEIKANEDIQTYLNRTAGNVDATSFRQILGAASDFKEGDESIGLSAHDEVSRQRARQLLANTKVLALVESSYLGSDSQEQMIRSSIDTPIYKSLRDKSVGELKSFLLGASEFEIKKIMPGLHSDVIAALVKLMSNEELIQIGQKVFNPLPNSSIGKKGYLSARLQPNSSTDHPGDIRWQVFNGWAFGVGDLMLGSNPASSTPEIVHRTELLLKDLVESFGLRDVLPWTVLSHIDIQNTVEQKDPGSTRLWFQSIAGNDETNAVFGTSAASLMEYARKRKGQNFGLYLEAGQGSEVTNGHSNGLDMGTLESRKYGLARALKHAQGGEKSWMVVNDVAGFIGPEVFRSKEQLVRVALEDTVMGKLHGLTMGLDICSTFHMPITPKDLRWAIDHIMPANPAYLMALPTHNDPMLSYNTTPFQEHLRIRQKFKYKYDERMKAFFIRLGIIDIGGEPTEHFGDPIWVYYQYQKTRGVTQSYSEFKKRAEIEMQEVQRRGVALSIGFGKNVWDFNADLDRSLEALDAAARASIHAPLNADFLTKYFPNSLQLNTQSENRDQYLSKPISGETLSEFSKAQLLKLNIGSSDVILVISDGLNSDSLMDAGHLEPYLQELKLQLQNRGLKIHPDPIIVHNARVRVSYRIGEELFAHFTQTDQIKSVINIVGERPGNGHNTYSAYLATASVSAWKEKNHDHDRTELVSGISDTSLEPRQAAQDSVEKILLKTQFILGKQCIALFN